MIKEGIQFRIRIDFIVQREIVTGLKYIQKTSRMGVTGKPSSTDNLMIRFYVTLPSFLQTKVEQIKSGYNLVIDVK